MTTDLSSQAAAVFTTAEESPAKTINNGYGKLDAVRKTVAMWRQKVSILRVAKANADSQASNGNRNSVPGSLETWTAKAGRLERELAKARRALELAKARLAAIAPTDVLLLSEEGN